MNQLHRISVSVFFIAALSLTPAAQAIDITIADSSTVGSEINAGLGATTDESVKTDTSFPVPTSVGSGGLTASADWTYVEDTTSAVFRADGIMATASSPGASSENYAELEFTVGSAVDYSLTGGASWEHQLGSVLAASVFLARKDEAPIVEIVASETSPGPIPIIFPSPFVIDFLDVTEDPATGVLDPGTYTLSFSVGVGPSLTPGTNRVTVDFAIILEDSGGSSEPLIDGTPIEGFPDWYRSVWFGDYSTAFAPWIFHSQHGFLYHSPGSTNESMFVYDSVMGTWWYTNETDYPLLYAFDPPADNSDPALDIEAAWLWYFEGSKSDRQFGVVTGADMGKFLYFGP